MTIRQVMDGLPALQKLAKEDLTPKTLYWVSKLLKRLDTEITFFNDERNKLIQELGADIGDGKWQVKKENIDVFKQKIEEIGAIEIEADFKVVKIPTTENISLSYNDLNLLDGLIELELVEE